MKALTWHGQGDVRVDTHPDPEIEAPTDVVIKITSTAICGSDLHLYDGFVPMMKEGDIIGHEPMGVVEEVGSGVSRLKKGDRVVVPFTISCGHCWFCDQTMYSLCDNTNPKPENARDAMGHSPAGIFGYSHLTGGIPGGQAEYLRVPHADVGPIVVPDGLTDEQVLFLSDIFPTGYMGAENAEIESGDTVAVWGCGPVGQFAIQSAWMLGAGRVIAIDREPERLRMARENSKAETVNFEEIGDDLHKVLIDMTDGRGPDRCIEAVGMEAHGMSAAKTVLDKAAQATHTQSDRMYALNQAIMACRKGGTISMPGVYAGAGSIQIGAFMNKALTLKTGQTHVQRYLDPLMKKIQSGEIDPSFVITHTAPLDDAPKMYETFRDKEDDCIKVVLKP
jgi:threonine dehydrogenase-like Zn-dependent dehydrogenase